MTTSSISCLKHLPLLVVLSVASLAMAQTAGSLFPPDAAKGRVIYPDFAEQGTRNEEVKGAVPLTSEEREIIASLADQPASRLIEMLNIYDRMDNRAMVDSIASVILQRIPDQPDALRIRKLVAERESVRKPGYLDQAAAEVLSGKRTNDADAAESQARFLLDQHRAEEAATILEKLRDQNFARQPFPYYDTLASCYAELHRWENARKAWQQIATSQLYPDILRQRAPAQLEAIGLELRIDSARAATSSDKARAVDTAKAILDANPLQPSAIAFYMDALHYAGRDAEALAFVKNLQANWSGPTPFPYQRLLAHSRMNLKQWDLAAEAFGVMADSPVFDEQARADASQGVALAGIARLGETASLAAEKGNVEEARSIIAKLETRYPDNVEVIGYKAVVMARTGDRDGALQLIKDRREKNPPGKPFLLQDTLGDLYIERKEFDLARAAFNDILAAKTTDWDQRRRATDGLRNVRKAELLTVAYNALRDRRTSMAESTLQQFREEFGAENEEARLLDAEILLARGRVMMARHELETIRRATPADKVFAADASLGSAQLQTGEWAAARDSFREVIRRANVVDPSELQNAKWEIRRAMEILQPAVTATAGYRKDGDGSVARASATYQTPWWSGWRAGVFSRLDDARMNQPTNDSYTHSLTRYEGGMFAQRILGPQLAVEGTLGATDSGEAVYGARFGNFINPGRTWSIGFNGNARSTDSTRLEAAGAREDRAEARFATPLAGPWNVDATVFANWLHIDSEKIGNGFGGSLNLDYVVQTETAHRPEFTLGWMAQYQHFNPSSSQHRDLFDGNTHYEGLRATVSKTVTDKLSLQAETSAFYILDDGSLGYAAALGGRYWLTDNASTFLNLRYTSDSRSSSTQSGAFEAELGASITF